jgi:hypothetical protein
MDSAMNLKHDPGQGPPMAVLIMHVEISAAATVRVRWLPRRRRRSERSLI